MTNSHPEDLTPRLDDIDNRLEQLGDEIDLIRTIQDGVRRETRANSQALARLERTVANLADIARLHQQALRTSQQNIDRIWEYLLRQGGNGNTPTN
ncbi:MAG: hypothetical protein RMX96_17200 [Nostoc sp. ChiSLP02]|nr:hypothetical protein [Nostoc sp. DedSLP05]MDZ8100015.1 hypothetical protein [Nostoc sp. DedSLP01]MDZ8186572.1 hypothetical protein [Nostoc sp. ChiSLP02]